MNEKLLYGKHKTTCWLHVFSSVLYNGRTYLRQLEHISESWEVASYHTSLEILLIVHTVIYDDS